MRHQALLATHCCIAIYHKVLCSASLLQLHVSLVFRLTLDLLNPDIAYLANSVDPDHLASEEANWSWSALFAIKYVNIYR